MRVVLSGFYGFENIGDEAILESIVDNLRSRFPDIDITVFSFSPEETAKIHNVKSLYRGWRRETFKKIQVLKKADLLISGGGGLLQDAYSTKIISGPIPYYSLIVLLAKLWRTKVMFFSQGIGPVTSPYGKQLVKRIANKVDLITVRDAESKQLLDKLGVNKPDIIVTADIVFAFQTKETNTSRLDKLLPSNKGPFVAVSVRPWFDQEDYLKRIADTLDLLITTKHITPVFIPMEGVHDYNTALKVAGQMTHHQQCILITPGLNSNDMIQLLKRCQFTIGMRLHSLIFSILAAIPYIGIVYDPKVESLMKMSDMNEFSIPMNSINPVEMAKLSTKFLENREKYTPQIAMKRDQLKKQALKNIDLLEQYFLKESVGEKTRESATYDHI